MPRPPINYGSMATCEVTDMSTVLKGLLDNIAIVSSRVGGATPRLVAVSKTKPPELIREAYDNGVRHFGENYVQELIEKSRHPLLSGLDIQWHFIGHLQSNKTNSLINGVPKLWMIETIDTPKLASAVSTSWSKLSREDKLKVFVQVNSSGEDSKHGCPPEGVLELTRHIMDSCPYLEFCGLMTIGRLSHDYSGGPNPDFELMKGLQSKLVEQLKLDNVELSMGMSGDYEEAIKSGSTNIRIGSNIFGARTYK